MSEVSKALTAATPGALIKLRDEADNLSARITEHYFLMHPECDVGDHGRIRRVCKADMAHHIAFIENAMETGIATIFTNYVGWLKSVLASRNLDTSHTRDAFVLLKQLLQEMFDGSDRELSGALLDMALEVMDEPGQMHLATFEPPLLMELDETVSYTEALVTGDRDNAKVLVNSAMDVGKTLVDVSVGLMQPAMYEIGRLWQNNRLTVAQEHLATAITQNILAHAYGRAEFKQPNNRRAIFACVETNYHALGLRMVSDSFEIEGWSVDYLGENVPTTSLLEMLDSRPVDLLGLSISLHDQVLALKQALKILRAELGGRCPPIAIGGLPLNTIPGLAQQLEADVWFPDAKSAVEQAK